MNWTEPRVPFAVCAVFTVACALLIGAVAPSVAQSRYTTGPSFGARTFAPRGLPPATMRDYTGRSPGALRPGTTTPGAPYVIPPAYYGKPDINLRKKPLPAPRQYVE